MVLPYSFLTSKDVSIPDTFAAAAHDSTVVLSAVLNNI